MESVAGGAANRGIHGQNPFDPRGMAQDVLLGGGIGGVGGRLGGTPGTTPKTPEVLRVGDVKLPAVPRGATGTPTGTGKGLEYPIPPGTPALSDRVASVRIMDPVTTGKYQYPDGYAVYMNQGGQTIDPLSGQTIANAHPYAHIPLK